jgi:hypothetical protein
MGGIQLCGAYLWLASLDAGPHGKSGELNGHPKRDGERIKSPKRETARLATARVAHLWCSGVVV